jgi:hypothetical protein
MGAEYCPYKVLFLAARPLLPLVGIGNDMNQAGFFNIRLYLIASLQQGLPL